MIMVIAAAQIKKLVHWQKQRRRRQVGVLEGGKRKINQVTRQMQRKSRYRLPCENPKCNQKL
jgi:hypothetical protein